MIGQECNNLYVIIITQNMSSNSIFLSILVFLILLTNKELQQGKKCLGDTVLNEISWLLGRWDGLPPPKPFENLSLDLT